MVLAPYDWAPDEVMMAALPTMLRWAAADPLISQVWAFGSRAGSRRNGPPRPDSDLDIGFQVVSRTTVAGRLTAGEWSGHGIAIAARARRGLLAEVGGEVDVQFMHPRLAPHAYAYGHLGHRIYLRRRRTTATDDSFL